MRRWLADCFHTVMTADAVVCDAAVVEYGGQPGGRVVTILAEVGCNYVIQCLARRLHAVVARRATTGNAAVIHVSHDAPCGGNMTVGTFPFRLHMVRRFSGGAH